MPLPFDPSVLDRAVRAELDARPVSAPQDAAPPSRAPLYWTLAGLAGGQAADAVTTYQALHRGAEEGNGSMYGAHPSAARIAATKAAAVGSLAWLTDRLYDQHPKTAMVLGGTIGALGLAAAVHNQRTGHYGS